MTAIELLAFQLDNSRQMVHMTLGDLSDADCLVRPVAGANHVNWQLGHLVNAEFAMISALKDAVMPALPEGFGDQYGKSACSIDDPARFRSKDELLKLFESVRQATIRYTQSLSPEALDAAGPERFQRLGKTVGQLIALQHAHVFMHLGQWQVLRRKLNKPILF
jgi:hypothetical protein